MKRFLLAALLVLPAVVSAQAIVRPGSLSDIRAGLRTIVAPDTVALYVDPATGSDSNSGTQAAPLATFPAALDQIPLSWRHKATIHLAAGTYTLPDLFAWYAGAPSGVNAAADYDGAVAFNGGASGGAGRNLTIRGSFATVDTGTVTSVTNTGGGRTYQIFDTGKAWTVSGNEGLLIRFTDGPAAGISGRIRANTATMNEALWPITPAVTVGTHYVIEQPSTIIQFKWASFYGRQGMDQAVSFDGIAWKPLVNNATVTFFGLASFHNRSTFGDGSGNHPYLYAYKTEMALAGNKASEASLGTALNYWCGVYLNNGTADWVEHAGTYTLGGVYAVVRGAAGGMVATNHSNVVIYALDSKNASEVAVTDFSEVQLFPSSQTGFASLQSANGQSSHGAYWVDQNSYLRMTQGAMVISSGANRAINIDHGSYALLTGTVSGTGNASYGATVLHGSKLSVGSGVSVTGVTNDVFVGATAGTWAGIQGGTPVVDVASQSAVFKE